MQGYVLQDYAITTTNQTLIITPVDKCLYKSVFFINSGANAITFITYGSPTGFTVEDLNAIGIVMTPAQVALHYIVIATSVVPANSSVCVNLTDYVYNYFRVDATTGSGESTGNFVFQKIDSLQ